MGPGSKGALQNLMLTRSVILHSSMKINAEDEKSGTVI